MLPSLRNPDASVEPMDPVTAGRQNHKLRLEAERGKGGARPHPADHEPTILQCRLAVGAVKASIAYHGLAGHSDSKRRFQHQ